MFRKAGAVLVASSFALLLRAGASVAEPPAPPVPAPPVDPALQRLIGTQAEGDFPIKGWEDMGGGLLEDPVWYAQYRRADGAQLVLVQWALPRRPGAKYLTFQITDVLVTPPLRENAALAFFCRAAQPNVTQKILAVVVPSPDQEWWRDIQQAWAVDLDSGHPFHPAGGYRMRQRRLGRLGSGRRPRCARASVR
ncbi:hypothetical protein [Methyloceanibacter superfactus]|nr:hypothetical protein [Methyloceanibacter superfactus]